MAHFEFLGVFAELHIKFEIYLNLHRLFFLGTKLVLY